LTRRLREYPNMGDVLREDVDGQLKGRREELMEDEMKELKGL